MPTPYNDVALLFSRTGCGASPTIISSWASKPLASVVNYIVDAPVPATDEPAGSRDSEYDANRYKNVVAWFVGRLAKAPALNEKMTLFWHGHLTSSAANLNLSSVLEQTDFYRHNALGSLVDLVQGASKSTAMLWYLDNHNNKVGKPNENFGRELMELFTLGVDQYTQPDVVDMARAWTGHGLETYWGPYKFFASAHDNGMKTIFGITKNWDGPDAVHEIYYGAKKQIAAEYLTAKLWTYFANSSAPPAVVTVLANVLIANDWSVKELLRAMFMRSEFYLTANQRGHVRGPADYIASAIFYSGVTPINAAPETYLDAMGQRLYFPPNVAGWHFNDAWLSTAAAWTKGNFSLRLASEAVKIGFLAGTSSVSVQTAVQRALDAFGLTIVSSVTRSAMEAAITAERAAHGTNEQRDLIAMTLMTPEFQVG